MGSDPQNQNKRKNSFLFDESAILKSLTKSIEKKPKKKVIIRRNIYRKLKIISKDSIKIRNFDYYKFPFNPEIENDESKLFNLIYDEWLVALTDLYGKYVYQKQHFYVSIGNDIVIFGENVSCSLEFRDILERNQIKYTVVSNFLIIQMEDSPLIFDYILNIELNIMEKLPFILSKKKFTNSISYNTKIVELKRVKDKENMKWYYLIEGYLYGPDFVEYSDHELHFEKT